jgi:hypothetical protein
MSQLRVPDQIRQLALSQKGDVLRQECLIAQAELRKLGISTESEIFAFFSLLIGTCLRQRRNHECQQTAKADRSPWGCSGLAFVRAKKR